jgi:hypothetical protein
MHSLGIVLYQEYYKRKLLYETKNPIQISNENKYIIQ